jgi:hypothetical protein
MTRSDKNSLAGRSAVVVLSLTVLTLPALARGQDATTTEPAPTTTQTTPTGPTEPAGSAPATDTYVESVPGGSGARPTTGARPSPPPPGSRAAGESTAQGGSTSPPPASPRRPSERSDSAQAVEPKPKQLAHKRKPHRQAIAQRRHGDEPSLQVPALPASAQAPQDSNGLLWLTLALVAITGAMVGTVVLRRRRAPS